MMKAESIIYELKALGNPANAKHRSSYFQTKEGQYAEGDIFLGLTNPQIRNIATTYKTLPLKEVEKLLQSKYHECRFAALVILVKQFERGYESEKETIYNFYLEHTQYINNWDLVDVSCYNIVGPWLLDKERTVLYDLSKSNCIWEQRIAIVSTYAFIRKNQFEDTLCLSEYFLTHTHHLIHKACGWMLREVGKRDKTTLTQFLDRFAPQMPRIMLRYSIEKLSEEERKTYLRAQIK